MSVLPDLKPVAKSWLALMNSSRVTFESVSAAPAAAGVSRRRGASVIIAPSIMHRQYIALGVNSGAASTKWHRRPPNNTLMPFHHQVWRESFAKRIIFLGKSGGYDTAAESNISMAPIDFVANSIETRSLMAAALFIGNLTAHA